MGIDVPRLKKILALMDSPNAGERDAAQARATEILKAKGKTWRDLPAILGASSPAFAPSAHPATAPAPNFADMMRGYGDWMEEREPGHKARAAAERAREAQEWAAFRAAVIARYGGEDAALKPTAMEAAVDAAAAPFLREEMYQFVNGCFPRQTLDGWSHYGDPISDEVGLAIRNALPLPTTIAEAKVETDAWRERDRELEAIRGQGGDTWLSLGCTLRQQIVTDLLHHDLRAVTIADALVRHRAISESGSYPSGKEAAAMLADLEYLATQQEAAPCPVQDGHGTARSRRAEVLRLLSDPTTAALSDREIARRVGVSPQTVGNIRRRAP